MKPKHPCKASAPHYCEKNIGIACALCSPPPHARDRIVFRSYNIQQSPLFSSPSSSSSHSHDKFSSYSLDKSCDGDIIGSESHTQICNITSWGDRKEYVPKQQRLLGRVFTKKQGIPPPISILNQDGPSYKRLFPLSRDSEDGRHERENEVKEAEYLSTTRENGRLIMELVTTNNFISSDDDWDQEISEDMEEHDERDQ